MFLVKFWSIAFNSDDFEFNIDSIFEMIESDYIKLQKIKKII